MKRIAVSLLLLGLCLQTTGCAIYQARFSPPVKQETNVKLKENDFELVERNLNGYYGYWSLQLGAYPYFALEIPLGDPRLFSNALADLYGESQSQMEGRPSQLVNWTLDYNAWFLPIPVVTPTRKNVTFRADLMEFTK